MRQSIAFVAGALAGVLSAGGARWKDVISALAEEHDTRCKLEPAKCPAAAGKP